MSGAAVLDGLLSAPRDQQRAFLAALAPAERAFIARAIQEREENPWAKYQGDPTGFITRGLGESVWSKQREVLDSVRDHKRTVVSATHAPGKSWLGSRVVSYFGLVYPLGLTRVSTTATSFRQVRNVLWPYIRRVHATHNLPGRMDLTQWTMGQNELVADGFSSAVNDETVVQGLHSPYLLLLVDEAAGISHKLGQAFTSILTGENARILVLGNPPTEEEGTWFQKITESPEWNHIRISAFDTPNFTGEETGLCNSCPPVVAPHKIATHLVDQEWVGDVEREFGKDSAYYQARVLAQFPRNVESKALPMDWVEAAMVAPDEDITGPISLGVDVASDGGDEFVIAQADGWHITVPYHAKGDANADAMDVAAVILRHIHAAEETHRERGTAKPVRVKVDSIGLGWGIVGILTKWGSEGRHGAVIVGVNVAEKASDAKKWASQRSEMWWSLRTLIAPSESTRVHLDIDQRTQKQMNAPKYGTDSSGRILIEKKDEVKKRIGGSPDRAEAILLAVFEPPAKVIPAASGFAITQSNPWAVGR